MLVGSRIQFLINYSIPRQYHPMWIYALSETREGWKVLVSRSDIKSFWRG